MTDVAISGLPAATSMVDTDVLPEVDGGATKKVTLVMLRQNVTGIVDSTGKQVFSWDWPIASITYNADGSVNVLTITGPTGSWTVTTTYTGLNVTSITAVGPAGVGTWIQTITYTGLNVTAVSAWIKQ